MVVAHTVMYCRKKTVASDRNIWFWWHDISWRKTWTLYWKLLSCWLQTFITFKPNMQKWFKLQIQSFFFSFFFGYNVQCRTLSNYLHKKLWIALKEKFIFLGFWAMSEQSSCICINATLNSAQEMLYFKCQVEWKEIFIARLHFLTFLEN